MTGQFCTVLAGCVFAMIFGTSTARAASGRIVFSGVIVAPTCSISDASAAAAISSRAGLSLASRHFTCGRPGTVADSGRSYTATVATLGYSATSNRLLNYFTGYVLAADPTSTSAKLVTETFN